VKRLILVAAGALLVGAGATIALQRLWSPPQSLNECLISHMKGQPDKMFAFVFELCQGQQKTIELQDSDIWPGKKADDWQPVAQPKP